MVERYGKTPNATSWVVERDPVELFVDAAERGDTSTVERAIASQSVDINGRNRAEYTALHRAVLAGHASVVSLLLDARANVNIAHSGGNTPMHTAAWFDIHPSITEKLLAAKADITLLGWQNSNVLHFVAYNAQGYVKGPESVRNKIKLFIQWGASTCLTQRNDRDELPQDAGNGAVASLLRVEGQRYAEYVLQCAKMWLIPPLATVVTLYIYADYQR